MFHCSSWIQCICMIIDGNQNGTVMNRNDNSSSNIDWFDKNIFNNFSFPLPFRIGFSSLLAVHSIVRKTADFGKKTQHVHQATDRIVIKLLKSKPRFLFLKWDRKLNNLTPDIQCIMVVSFLFQVHSQLQCRRNFKTIASKRERVFFYQIILIALAARTHHQNVQQRKCIHSNAMDP